MRLVNLRKKPPYPHTMKRSQESRVGDLVEHFMVNAKKGVGYGVSTLIEEAINAELFTFKPDDLAVVTHAINALITEHGWRQVGHAPIFTAPGKEDPSLVDTIQYFLSTGASFDVHIITKGLDKFVDEVPEIAHVRKALQRLVSSGKVMRVDRGIYQKTHKGF